MTITRKNDNPTNDIIPGNKTIQKRQDNSLDKKDRRAFNKMQDEINNLQSLIENLEKEKEDYKNKWHNEIAEKVKLRDKIQELQNQIKEIKKENDFNSIKDLKEENHFLNVMLETVNIELVDKEETEDVFAEEPKYTDNTLLFGGYSGWQKKFAAKHPNVRIFSGVNTSFSENLFTKNSVVLVNSDYMSHSVFYKIRKFQRQKGFKIVYLK